MELRTRIRDGVVVVDLIGQADGTEIECATLNAMLGDLCSEGETLVVFNADEVERIGEGTMVMLLKALTFVGRTGGHAAIVNSAWSVVTPVIPIVFSDERRAIRALKKMAD